MTKTDLAKKYALIAVKEIIELDVWHNPHNAEQGSIYWDDVRNEIFNL